MCTLHAAGVAECQDKSVIAIEQTNFFGDYKFDGLENGDYVVEIEAEGKTKSIDVKIENKSDNLGYIEM